MRIIPEYKVSTFGGLWTEQKDLREIPDGYTPDAINWITFTDKKGIELRRGTALLGQTRNTGAGKVTGLGVGTRFDGLQIPFFSYGRKVKYYDATTDDTIEVGSNLLPAAADGDEVSIFPYQNLAGAWVYASSPNSSVYKIPVANPGSAVDQTSTTYRGFLKFGQSRSFLYNRHGATAGNKDQVGLYQSKVDKVALSQYPTQVTGEAVGSSGSTSYTHTLTDITGKRTAMYVTVSATVAAGTETFVDDRSGSLVSNFGGTGTVNYATGAIAVTFSDTTTGAVTCAYYYEDATSGGVVDFSISNPAARVAGEGNYFPQFDGGGLLSTVFSLGTIFYCIHQLKTWQVSMPADDGAAATSIFTNLPFRENLGVESRYGAYGAEDGIYIMNTAEAGKPEFVRAQPFTGGTQSNTAGVRLLSKLIDFSPYVFDQAVVFSWREFVVVCAQQVRNGATDAFNSLMFLYNKKTDVWDLCDNPASVLADYMGTLIAGDPITNNVFTLFSGFDDDGVDILNNYWTSGQTNLRIEGQKRFTRMVLQGLIQSPQGYEVDLSFDGGAFTNVFTVEGDGVYVDTGQSIAVGARTLGSKVAGGGSTVYANPYRVEFTVQTPRFTYVRVRFKAIGGGYVSINSYSYKDIREKSGRSMPIRTVL